MMASNILSLMFDSSTYLYKGLGIYETMEVLTLITWIFSVLVSMKSLSTEYYF